MGLGYHPLGDGASCAHFCHTLSRFYQQMEAPDLFPIFERRLWRKDECDRVVSQYQNNFEMLYHLQKVQKSLQLTNKILFNKIFISPVNNVTHYES